MSIPQDFVTDNNPTAIFHIEKTIGTPDYVKSAAVIQKEDVDDRANVAFADPVNRLWPIYSKVATWCSAADFFGKRIIGNEKVASNIRNAARIWEIEEDVAKVEEVFNSLEKQASSPDKNYALVVDFGGEFGNSQPTGFYPINEYGEILTSAENMMKDASTGALPSEYFRTASVALVKAAREHGVHMDELHNRIVRYGTLRMPDFQKAAASIEERRKDGLSDDKALEYTEILEGAEAEFSKNASEGIETAVIANDKWVDLWCSLDREYDVKYANVTNPFDAFYCGQAVSDIEKMATTHLIISDILVPRGELTSLTDREIEQRFNAEDAETIKSAKQHCGTYRDELGITEAHKRLDTLDKEATQELLSLMASRN